MNRRQFLPMIFAPAFANWKANAATTGGQWPQWRGPERNGLSKETGLDPGAKRGLEEKFQ